MMGKHDQGTTDSYLKELMDIIEKCYGEFKQVYEVVRPIRSLKKLNVNLQLDNLNFIAV